MSILKFVSLLLFMLIFCSCGNFSGNQSPAIMAPGNISDTESSGTDAPDTSSGVIFSDEVYNGMNVYRIRSFDSEDAVDWKSVPAAAIDNYGWIECTKYEAWAKLVFIKDWGFICKMTCVESSPAATYRNFDDPVCLDSCMEFFAAWDGGKDYLNIESNSIGTLCVGFGPSRNSRVSGKTKLPLDEMFSVTPEVDEESWTLTIKLPIEKLRKFYPSISADTFAAGYEFTGNFYKTGSAQITGNEHYGMWNEVKTENPDFHQPSYFGKFIIE